MRATLAFALVPTLASAQARVSPSLASVGRRAVVVGPTSPSDGANKPALVVQGRAASQSLWAIAASAVVPGSGQAILGERRFLPYFAFELFSWIQYSAHVREARARRLDYRNLASAVARAPFSAFRPTGPFEYYERLEHFLESGAYDATPGGDLDPEPDTSTYNGSVWLLARRTFWKDPSKPPDRTSHEWDAAEQFYRRRAANDEFRWSWRNAQLEYDEFRRLIRGSNDANRRAVQDLGLMIANHTLSMVDAYITIRVRRRSTAGGERTEFGISLPLP